jgi:hypothetical protein
MKRYEPVRRDEMNPQDVKDRKAATVVPPTQTYDRPPFVLDDGTRRVEFHFFGWTRTRGFGFMHRPKEQALATGDAITNGPFNHMADAHIANWPKVAEAAGKRPVRDVLPGHGWPERGEVIAGQARFMRGIYAGVKEMLQAGKTVDDLQKMGLSKTLEVFSRARG